MSVRRGRRTLLGIFVALAVALLILAGYAVDRIPLVGGRKQDVGEFSRRKLAVGPHFASRDFLF